MGNLKAVVPIAVSLIIAVAGSFFLYQWIQRQRGPREVVQVQQTEAVPIVVAAAELPWGTKLKPEMIKTAAFLKESLPQGHFSGTKDLVGRIVVAPLKANDPITEHKLAPTSIETGGVSAVLRPGKRAIAVKGDKVIGIAGFINPGNSVDVLVTVKNPDNDQEKTKIVLENLRVLATGTQIQENAKGEPAPVDVFTLEVGSEEAEKLALAATEGQIQLALRSVTDTEDVYTEGITIPQLLASYSNTRPESPVRYYPKPVEREKAVNPKPAKKVRKWRPRRAVTVEIIKGTEVTRKNFSM